MIEILNCPFGYEIKDDLIKWFKLEKQNKALADYQVAFAQYQQENMVSEVIRMAQVRGIAETQKLRRAKEAQLKGMRKTIDQFISEHVAANPDAPISA